MAPVRGGYQRRAREVHFSWLYLSNGVPNVELRITSYINNLHPREKDLYALVEEIVEASILLWGLTLSPVSPQNPLRRIDGSFQRITPRSLSYEIDMTKSCVLESGPQPELGERYLTFDKRWSTWQEEASVVDVPEPDTDFADLEEELFAPPFDLRQQFKDQGLQVIVKMTDIHLTPAQPSYDGSLWQVQGHLVRLFPIFVPSFHEANGAPISERTHHRHIDLLLLQ